MLMPTVAIARKWGNSLGITLPRELVEQQNIKEGDALMLPVIIKKANLSKIFGSIKTGESGQKFKDRAREGWKD
jgi:antitoxin component of MazEF toxin-antitoxin module